jgi:hypothetical protein
MNDRPWLVDWHAIGRLMRQRQRAQATVWLVMLTLVLGLVFGLLADGAVLFADQRWAGQLADSAARAGASQLDETALRDAPAQPPRLAVGRAEERARQYVVGREPAAEVEPQANPAGLVVRVRLHASTSIAHLPGQDGVDVVAEGFARPVAGLAQPDVIAGD